MANQQRGEVSIEIEGKVYTLRPDFNAICEAEDLTGKPLAEIAAAANRGDMRANRALIWAYLQPVHSAEIVTLKDAGALIGKVGLDTFSERLVVLTTLNAAPADDKKEGKGNPPAAQVGTGDGSTSTPSGSA